MLKITILHHVLSSPSTGISHASAAALRSAALLTGGPTRFGWERWAELAVQWAKSWGFHGTLTCGVNVDYIKWLAYDSRHVVDVFFFSVPLLFWSTSIHDLPCGDDMDATILKNDPTVGQAKKTRWHPNCCPSHIICLIHTIPPFKLRKHDLR